jgi:acyl-CoA reductase-like NAD-dependent aldehyde dehydrogenase
MGPLISAEHRAGVHNLVERGRIQGARLVTGG